jgi:hypothetical protein
MSITRLEDARALKQIGAPLNTPIEGRTFTTECSRHWFRVMKAHADFMVAVRSGKRAGTMGKWRALKRRLKALGLTRKGPCDGAPRSKGAMIAKELEPDHAANAYRTSAGRD